MFDVRMKSKSNIDICRMLTAITSPLAPPPIGPYSQAIRVGNMLFCSGQVALGTTGQEALPQSLSEQTHLVMENLKAVLEAGEASFANVAKTSIFLIDMADFAAVNEVYATYLTPPYPARETVAVAGLPRGARVEISCIAHVG